MVSVPCLREEIARADYVTETAADLTAAANNNTHNKDMSAVTVRPANVGSSGHGIINSNDRGRQFN